jgi:hypothetical protein
VRRTSSREAELVPWYRGQVSVIIEESSCYVFQLLLSFFRLNLSFATTIRRC